MKKIHLFFILCISLTLYNCVGEDIIDDAVAQEIRILNPIETIEVTGTYQINTRFFNNVGQEQDVVINWSSENTAVATVDTGGLVTAISEGSTNIVAKATVEDELIENKIFITVTPDTSGPKLEEIVFSNPIESIVVADTYQYNVNYFNDLGEVTDVDITWFSDNTSVATIDTNGVVTGVSEGIAIIKAFTTINGETIEEITTLEITELAQNLNSKSGTIITTSSYVLEGDFILSELSSNPSNLELVIANNYRASTSLPGLYIYLSNNPNSIANAFEIGAVTTFNGAHSYTLENKGINDYAYVLYWCKPFGVKVGEGRINN